MTLFAGFTLKDDRTTLAGLPNPIHEGVRVLNSHMYRSLAELQIEVRIKIFFLLDRFFMKLIFKDTSL